MVILSNSHITNLSEREITTTTVINYQYIRVDSSIHRVDNSSRCVWFSGFAGGYIWWDDVGRELFQPSSIRPDGVYNDNTRIQFCCRHDGPAGDRIRLPTEKPFFLLKQGNSCQLVEGMTVAEEYLYVDTQDFDLVTTMTSGQVPTNDYGRVSGYMKLYYCYYKKWTRWTYHYVIVSMKFDQMKFQQ